MSSTKLPSLIRSTVSHVKTKADFTQANHLWIINDFGRIHIDRGVALYSSRFSADNIFQWQLILNPIIYDGKERMSLSLNIYEDYMNKIERQHFPVTGIFKASIMDIENQAAKTISTNFIKSSVYSSDCSGHKLYNFVEKDDLFEARNKLLPQDRLTILCEVNYMKQSDVVCTSGQSFSFVPVLKKIEPTDVLLEDFKKLFKDGKLADVTLRVGGKRYPAHKCILAARSPVFRAKLNAGRMDKKINRLEINDLDESVFIEMLRYIYTGKVKHLKKNAIGLLEAADKYDLKQLRDICVNALIENLSKNNVKDILCLADKYNSKDLKNAAVQFSQVNFLNWSIKGIQQYLTLAFEKSHSLKNDLTNKFRGFIITKHDIFFSFCVFLGAFAFIISFDPR